MIPVSIIRAAIGVYTLFMDLVGTDVSTKAYAIIQHDRILIREAKKHVNV